MKAKIYFRIITLLFIAICNKTFAQSANTTLSNLTAPTKINVHLLPDRDHVRNLGSLSKSWKNLYLDSNVFIGGALFIYTPEVENTFVGVYAGGAGSKNGRFNSFFGSQAGYSLSGADQNSFFRYETGYANTTGQSNSFFGSQAGFENISGSANVFAGQEAGVSNTTGGNNTYVGYHAGNTGTTGSSNTIIGYGADIKGGSLSNATAIGNLAVVGASNHIHIGNSSVTSIGGQVSWTSFSDERIKSNIKENVPGLAFIILLKPVTYNFDINKQQELTGKKDPTQWIGKYDIQKIQFTGFIAQDVEVAAKKINYDFSGIDKPANDKDVYGLRYSDFVVPLVKGEQELSKQTDSLKSIVNSLQNQINELKTMIVSNQSTLVPSNAGVHSQQLAVISSASLQQNIPNPFTNTTTIGYYLPGKFSSVKIIVTDKTGKQLKQIDINGTGKGIVTIDASTLSSGAYQYSLYVDGRLIDSKQMILAK